VGEEKPSIFRQLREELAPYRDQRDMLELPAERLHSGRSIWGVSNLGRDNECHSAAELEQPGSHY
jgi:hypothetical protein